MSFLVVGTGSMGRRHYQNLRHACPDARVFVLSRPHSATPGWLPEADHVTALDVLALSRFAGAVVANPAPFHHEVAVPLLEAGVPVLVEKPLAHDSASARTIFDAASRSGTPMMVGYTLRWYEPLQDLAALVHGGRIGRPVHLWASVGSNLEAWRPSIDYRASVTAQRALGGGALLELSHEIDYCLWMMGRPLAVCSSLRDSALLDIDVEDVADLHIDFESGALASVHLDLIDRRPHRRCRVVGTDGTAELDLIGHELTVTDRSGVENRIYEIPSANEMYLRQQGSFLAMAEDVNNASDGPVHDAAVVAALTVLDVVEAARLAAESGRRTVL